MGALPGMWLQVLGPVRGRRDGVDLNFGPPQQRCVLGALVAAAGTPVSSATLVDVLWGGAPPAGAAATIQQYVSRLRRILEPGRSVRAAAGIIRRASGGYQLVADDGEVDLLRWRGLVEQARRLAALGDDDGALTGYAEAFALWSGQAVADLPAEVRGHPVFAVLDHEHVTLLCEAADLALAAGRGEMLLEELERAAGWYPFDEGLQARVLRALAAAGRRVEALRRFRRLRDLLVRDLGVEPGPLLQQAHQELLVEAETRPSSAAALGAGPRPGPAQLPADLRSFSGRDAELDRLDDLVDDPMPLVMVTGLGGVGKTSLALRWAHGAAERFPDGQLYVDLRGFAPQDARWNPLRRCMASWRRWGCRGPISPRRWATSPSCTAAP